MLARNATDRIGVTDGAGSTNAFVAAGRPLAIVVADLYTALASTRFGIPLLAHTQVVTDSDIGPLTLIIAALHLAATRPARNTLRVARRTLGPDRSAGSPATPSTGIQTGSTLGTARPARLRFRGTRRTDASTQTQSHRAPLALIRTHLRLGAAIAARLFIHGVRCTNAFANTRLWRLPLALR